MDLSNLKLLIEKGPREGETLEFNSKLGFTVRIGSAARGNTIAIKGDGVSSKHLSIEWCSDGSKWEVKDLDSSNGTFLNSSALPPHAVHDLRDGDELKIGEVTKIRVRISLVSHSQPVGRSLRSRARVLGTANSDDTHKAADEGNRRGRSSGNRTAAVGDGGLGSEVSASTASVNVRRGRSREKKIANLEDDLEEISENVECVTQKGRPASKKRTRSSKNDEAVEVECKVEPANSLRRSTRSRGMKNKDSLELSSALERIPEASQLVSSVNCEALNTRRRRGMKKNEIEMGSEEEHSEGDQIARESLPNVVEEGEQLVSGLISGHENCNELEFAVVKTEPQSSIGRIVGRGESMSEIVQNDGDLASELNFELETVEEELEATLNQDDKRESECNVESTADADSTEKEAEAEVCVDLNKMTLGEWFDHLERFLPKQIRAERDQIVQDMLNRSKQFNEFMLQKQKDKGTLPFG